MIPGPRKGFIEDHMRRRAIGHDLLVEGRSKREMIFQFVYAITYVRGLRTVVLYDDMRPFLGFHDLRRGRISRMVLEVFTANCAHHRCQVVMTTRTREPVKDFRNSANNLRAVTLQRPG